MNKFNCLNKNTHKYKDDIQNFKAFNNIKSMREEKYLDCKKGEYIVTRDEITQLTLGLDNSFEQIRIHNINLRRQLRLRILKKIIDGNRSR